MRTEGKDGVAVVDGGQLGWCGFIHPLFGRLPV